MALGCSEGDGAPRDQRPSDPSPPKRCAEVEDAPEAEGLAVRDDCAAPQPSLDALCACLERQSCDLDEVVALDPSGLRAVRLQNDLGQTQIAIVAGGHEGWRFLAPATRYVEDGYTTGEHVEVLSHEVRDTAAGRLLELTVLRGWSASVPDMGEGPPLIELQCLRTTTLCVLGPEPSCPLRAFVTASGGQDEEGFDPYRTSEVRAVCRDDSVFDRRGSVRVSDAGCVTADGPFGSVRTSL